MTPRPFIAGRTMLAVCLGTVALASGDSRAQDQAPTVSELVVTAPAEVPLPQVGEGAPLFSPAEIAEVGREARLSASTALSHARHCSSSFNTSNVSEAVTIRQLLAALYRAEQQAERAVAFAADQAQAASVAARADRQAGARGERTEEQLAASELARQEAVNRYTKARGDALDARARTADAQRLVREAATSYPNPFAAEFSIMAQVRGQLTSPYRPPTGPGGPPVVVPAQYADLVIEDVMARQREDKSGTYILVTGRIRNPKEKAIAMPALSVMAIDVSGFPVKTETAEGRGRIGAGEAVAFQYELRPKPSQAQTVAVTFASRDRPLMTLPYSMPLLPPPPAGGGNDDPPRTLDCSDGTLDPINYNPRSPPRTSGIP
jgi:hypothetical protein